MGTKHYDFKVSMLIDEMLILTSEELSYIINNGLSFIRRNRFTRREVGEKVHGIAKIQTAGRGWDTWEPQSLAPIVKETKT